MHIRDVRHVSITSGRRAYMAVNVRFLFQRGTSKWYILHQYYQLDVTVIAPRNLLLAWIVIIALHAGALVQLA
jgi:hypothetical protein